MSQIAGQERPRWIKIRGQTELQRGVIVMECITPWTGAEIEPWEVAFDTDKECLLAQTPHWTVRKASCGGAGVVLYSCRATPLKLELWTAALDALKQFVAPFPHPNLVQFLGVVTPSEEAESEALRPSECVVMEYLPVSLYDVLHRDHVSLSRREIALIAIHVLHGLLFLHRKHQALGVCLTSKKVLMDGTNSIKLRRFGLEMVLRSGKAPPQLTSPALRTVYEMAPASTYSSASTSSFGCSSVSSLGRLSPPRSSLTDSHCSSPPTIDTLTSSKRDLFAFGVLLLEMCAGEKPTNELFNRISCAKQIDPVFYSVLQLTMSLGGAIMIEGRRKSEHVTAQDLLNILVANEQQRAVEELRLSSASFPCFLYADRYFASKEAEQIEFKLRERDRRGDVDLKRLAAVEQELVEEQRNFTVLVLQIEQAQKEKAHEIAEKELLRAQVAAKEQSQRHRDDENMSLLAKVQEQADRILAVQASLDEERGRVEVMKLAKMSDAEEKQGLLFEILKLKEEKRKLTTEKEEIASKCAAIARKVGGEKEALEDVEGRLAQAIHRWEEEQRMRRKAERQAEAASRQLLQMEEERCKYSSVLQQCPTGKLAPKASVPYVLSLKDKEVEELSRQLQIAFDDQTALRNDIAQYEVDSRALRAEKDLLITHQANALLELRSLNSQIEEHEETIADLSKQLRRAHTETEVLKSRIVDFEEELDRQAKKKADEENARQLRQCLTPQCDAPRFLVGASGYCKECEERSGRTSSSKDIKQERHRRHRSWDDASIGSTAVRKNVRNIPIMKLVRVLSAADDTRVEDSDQQQLLEALKQLTALLKSNESLKDDLPECLVIKSVLALMHQYKTSLVLQLECCKCLSLIVFNHDRNRLIVVAEGGVEPVLVAMKTFQMEPKMQETSCVLLTNLAHNCETNRKRILDAGGIDTVLQAMQTYPEHCGVQKRCCWALLTLAGSDLMCDSIALRGGLGAIIAAMLNCPADEHVQFYGSWALVNLLSGTERLQAFARREGVREVAEAAHACFPGHEGIQEKTLEILHLLQ